MSAALAMTEKWLRGVSLAAAVLGGAVMLAMLCVITANIALRPFGGSIRGTVEISGYLCALAVGLCMPAAQLAGSHISAGLWASSLPRRVRQARRAVCNALCAGLLFLVSRELFGLAQYARDMGEYIEGFDISYYPMAVGFAFGIGLHALLFLQAVILTFTPGTEDT